MWGRAEAVRDRISECEEVGSIVHRAGTRLRPGGRCRRGHEVAGRYWGGECPACAKLRAYRSVGRLDSGWVPGRPGPRPAGVAFFAEYAAARLAHEVRGGWLLDMGSGGYAVTDREDWVVRWRGWGWVDACECLQSWDEVEVNRAAGRGR